MKFLLAAGLLAVSLPSMHAETAPRIPVTDFFKNPKISSATISPDGKRFAFLAPEGNRLNIWVGDADEDFSKAKAVTHDKERGVFHFFWSRDGKYLIYEQDKGGDENFHLYRVDPSKPDEPAVDLTPEDGARAEVIHLPSDKPDEALVAMNARDKRYFDVYHLTIGSGKLELVEKNPGDVDAWYADNDGVIRATTAQVAGGKTEIRVRDKAGDPFRVIGTFTSDESASVEGFSEDNKAILLAHAKDSNTTRLVSTDIASGKETVISEDPEYDFGSALISDKTHKLLGVSYVKDRAVYVPFDEQLKKDLAFLSKLHDGDIMLRSSDADEKKWIVAYNSPTDPGATYLYDRDKGDAKFLYRPRPWLKPETLVGMKPVEFKSRDGLDLHGYLTLPKGVEPKNLPTVIVVHGGPWARDEWGYDPEIQLLANRGYAVLQINYRGSTGYGKKFLHAGDREWGSKMLDDLVDGVNWLVAEGISDPKRMGIYGGSYGGYATLSALAFQPDVFACGIDYVGVSNLLTFMNTIPPYWETFREVMYQRVGDPEKDKEFLKSRSPLFAADKIKVPLFVAQGYNDPRVNHAEAEQIVEALKKNGHPVEYMVKMDEGHGFANPENNIDFYQHMESFLEKHLPVKSGE